MSDLAKKKVSKLLHVLVAGGVALAGAPAVRADDPPGAMKHDGAKQEKAEGKAAAKKEKEAKDKKGMEKQKKEHKAEEKAEGGGVKGW